MSSTQCSIADESHLCPRAARTPFQPVVSPDSDSEDIDDLDPVFETIPFRRSHHRQINQYISGGRGGRGGGAGVYGSGGAGGPGEGPILQYDIRAECLTMRTYMTTQTKISDYLQLPLGSSDLRNEIRLDAAAGVVSRHDGRSLVRRMYSARVG
ncbi:hypothetical protein C8R45DRAFT_1108977 [Mycena sanguinolenta]|nr:hypothetical protein C8R45DRAFT_1108977 [Mycena sanguinolenta]